MELLIYVYLNQYWWTFQSTPSSRPAKLTIREPENCFLHKYIHTRKLHTHRRNFYVHYTNDCSGKELNPKLAKGRDITQ